MWLVGDRAFLLLSLESPCFEGHMSIVSPFLRKLNSSSASLLDYYTSASLTTSLYTLAHVAPFINISVALLFVTTFCLAYIDACDFFCIAMSWNNTFLVRNVTTAFPCIGHVIILGCLCSSYYYKHNKNRFSSSKTAKWRISSELSESLSSVSDASVNNPLVEFSETSGTSSNVLEALNFL